MNLLSIIRGSSFSCTNGPYRFICNCNMRKLLFWNSHQGSIKLSFTNFFCTPYFTLSQKFPDTDNYIKTCCKGTNNFCINKFITFTELITPFRMTKNYNLNTKILQHCNWNFSCMSTIICSSTVLGSKKNVCTFYNLSNWIKINKRRSNHYLVFAIFKLNNKFLNKFNRTFLVHIHLPVSGHISRTHIILPELF